jgi:hypothetical protein
MLMPIKQSILSRLILLIAIALAAPAVGMAQVVYDWSSDSETPESYPKVTRRANVTFTITNVNNILFTYKLTVTQEPIASDDFKHLAGLFKNFTGKANTAKAAAGVVGSCTSKEAELLEAFKNANQAINDDPKLPVGYAASATHTSIPLVDSVNAWRSHAALLANAVKLEEEFLNGGCALDQEAKDLIDGFKERILKIDTAVNSPHVFVSDRVLSPGNNYSATVLELYVEKTVKTKTFKFPGVDILTLSAGPMFSGMPDRVYEARKTPNATESVLTVEGNSRATPSLLALLNYSLAGLRLERDDFGLALSAGPVIRLGGKSDASSFGFFSGLSAHLGRRFFVTPGVHFGQFSDFPVGFGNGSVVPANFGELKPVKRWTARAGLGITFKTNDFSGLVSSEAPSVTGSEAGGAAKKTRSPSVDDRDAVSEALTGRIRKSFVRRTPTAGSVSDSRPDDTRPLVASREADGPPVRIMLRSSMSSTDDRISITASGTIQNYVTYFKSSRFYLLIPRAQLDAFRDDDLRGSVFSEALIEKRGDDLVLSLLLTPGARVSILERHDGLDLILVPANPR